MKSFAKSFLVALTIGVTASFASFATPSLSDQPIDPGSFKSGIYTSSDGKLHVALNKQVGRVVTIELKNDKNETLYIKRLHKKEEACRLVLNVNELTDGVYQLAITSGTETVSKSVTLTTSQPQSPKRLIQTDVLASN